MTAPDPSHKLFPPRPVEVPAYHMLVSSSYIFSKDDLYENAENYRVDELCLYKSIVHPYHEYVVAHVVNPHTKPVFLLLERTRPRARDDNTTEDEFLARIPNTRLANAFKDALRKGEESTDFTPEDPASSPSPVSASKSTRNRSSSTLNLASRSISESSDSFDNLTGTLAEDTAVAINSSHFANAQRLDTLHPKNLPVSRLACLAEVVHEQDPLYNVFSAQCYWYANLIMKVIERESEEGQNKNRRRAEQLDVFRLVRFRRGTWLRIPVGSVEEGLVDVISEKFQSRWQERMTQIHAAVNHPGQRDQEEVRAEAETEQLVAGVRGPEEVKSRDELERENALLKEALRRSGMTYPPGVE